MSRYLPSFVEGNKARVPKAIGGLRMFPRGTGGEGGF